MPDNICVASDGSPLAERALTYALDTVPDAARTTSYVINPSDSVIDVEGGGLPVAEDWYDTAQKRATEIQTTATDLAAEHDVGRKNVTKVGKPGREIPKYADSHGINQNVMGATAGQVSTRRFSVAETVTRRARIPVTIIG